MTVETQTNNQPQWRAPPFEQTKPAAGQTVNRTCLGSPLSSQAGLNI